MFPSEVLFSLKVESFENIKMGLQIIQLCNYAVRGVSKSRKELDTTERLNWIMIP